MEIKRINKTRDIIIIHSIKESFDNYLKMTAVLNKHHKYDQALKLKKQEEPN